MIVDDSLTVRTIFKRMVESDGALVIAGTASSAEGAIAQLKSVPTDVVLLDLDMPGMGGLDAMPEILGTAEGTQVLVVSSLTDDGAEHTMSALSMGAADTMLKPRPGGFNDEYRSQLLAKIKALGSDDPQIEEVAGKASNKPVKIAPNPLAKSGKKYPEVIAIGASTGGIHALNLFLERLPAEFDVPILVTQHLPASFIPVFARQVAAASGRKTNVAEKGTVIRPGEITIATGEGHLVVHRSGNRLVCRIAKEAVSSGCWPSVDPMISSLSKVCEGHVLTVILSGMGRDGLEGARDLIAQGGTVFAQDPETSAVWGMPGAVSKAGYASAIGSPEELAKAVLTFTTKTRGGSKTWK